jgi:hypothetical protein
VTLTELAAKLDAIEAAEGGTVTRATIDTLRDVATELRALGVALVAPVAVSEPLTFPGFGTNFIDLDRVPEPVTASDPVPESAPVA